MLIKKATTKLPIIFSGFQFSTMKFIGLREFGDSSVLQFQEREIPVKIITHILGLRTIFYVYRRSILTKLS